MLSELVKMHSINRNGYKNERLKDVSIGVILSFKKISVNNEANRSAMDSSPIM